MVVHASSHLADQKSVGKGDELVTSRSTEPHTLEWCKVVWEEVTGTAACGEGVWYHFSTDRWRFYWFEKLGEETA